jgi:sugar lactone lactonase YvrE
MLDVRVVLDGLEIGESPRWHEGRLWFSNWGRQEIIAVDQIGNSEVMLRVSTTIPFSIDWLPAPDRRLLVVSGREGLLLRQEADGSLVTHADLHCLSSYPWNEIVVDGRSNIYINNIGFDFPGGAVAPGIVALVTPGGHVRQVADGLMFPNGMAITADNSTLIVAESYTSKLTEFDIAADGSLLNRREWADLNGGAPDGICLDAEGAVWYADVPNRCCVRVREGGEVLQRVELDRGCFACMLGGPNGTTLFMLCAEWRGIEGLGVAAPAGQLTALRTAVSAPRAGWP